MKLIAYTAAVFLVLLSYWIAQDGDRISRSLGAWLRARRILPGTDTFRLFGHAWSVAILLRSLVLLLCLGLFMGSVAIQVAVGFTWYDVQVFTLGSKVLFFLVAAGLMALVGLLYIITHAR